MFVVVYTVKFVYICVNVTCSKPYCLCYTIIDPRNACIYACT